MLPQSLMMSKWTVGKMILGLKGIDVVILCFGAWSATHPQRSIALYQAIMRLCNWRVEPIDRQRELLTTRWLGILLTCCSLVGLVLLR